MEKLYWIWSAVNASWWRSRGKGYTNNLHEAFKYSASEAHEIEENSNRGTPDDDYPEVVLIPVNENYLPRSQRAEFAATLADGASDFDELDALVKSLEELEAKKKK